LYVTADRRLLVEMKAI